MSRKVLIVTGSPRENGNTQTLAGWVAEGACAAGAAVTVVNAARLKYAANGCTACMRCQKAAAFECGIADEAQPVLRSMPGYDAIVFATPVYFFGPSAQLKLLLDRMYSLFKFSPDGVRHCLEKTALALVACGGGDVGSGLQLIEQTFRAVAGFSGKRLVSLLVPFASGPGEMADKEEIRARALAMGKDLAEGRG